MSEGTSRGRICIPGELEIDDIMRVQNALYTAQLGVRLVIIPDKQVAEWDRRFDFADVCLVVQAVVDNDDVPQGGQNRIVDPSGRRGERRKCGDEKINVSRASELRHDN